MLSMLSKKQLHFQNYLEEYYYFTFLKISFVSALFRNNRILISLSLFNLLLHHAFPNLCTQKTVQTSTNGTELS